MLLERRKQTAAQVNVFAFLGGLFCGEDGGWVVGCEAELLCSELQRGLVGVDDQHQGARVAVRPQYGHKQPLQAHSLSCQGMHMRTHAEENV